MCSQMANVCIFSSYSHFSCVAGYNVCAWGAWMEDISNKWGKRGTSVPCYFMSSYCPECLVKKGIAIVASVRSIILI